MTRDEFLARIDLAYAYRVKGDMEGIRSMFAPDGVFRIGGGRLPLPGVLYDEPSAITAIASLIETYSFRKVERLDALVDGNKAAVHWRAEIVPPDGHPHSVELFDYITAGRDGRFTSFVQFVDAGFVATLARR